MRPNSSENLSRKSVDLLLNSILKKNGASLRRPTLSMKEKQELKRLIKDLQQSVNSLTKSKKV